ncbi:50S ribosomal protein L28 [Candidatus Bipolaricaulota bacterium]|nr:50S ribosomal protein L28 [Candidatus Bipolaricaulota bacterium]MBS3814849.1 50S ribosomal protein L28 [Candidatus Bipolaricaulota bacterium]MBS3825820.1 50S ribosomal protein L28 [Candidatus Bipolaricaulota bacterium]
MANKCEICGKGTSFGNNVSNSNQRSRRTRKPNLQRVKVWEDGKKVKKTVCTDCIKSGKVKKAI